MLAVAALLGGKYYGWNWLDPVMGLVGAVLVAVWAWSLLRDTGRVLLDYEVDQPTAGAIATCIEKHPGWRSTSVTDLHLWRVGRSKYACILTLVTDEHGLQPEDVRRALADFGQLAHVTVEVNPCPGISAAVPPHRGGETP